jgi:hypothetical protein
MSNNNTNDLKNQIFTFTSLESMKIVPDPNDKGKRTFKGTAYGGGIITDSSIDDRVMFDLLTTKAPKKMPVLLEHDPKEVVGFTETVEIGSTMEVTGVISSSESGKKVAQLADEGFPWQMSVRIYPEHILVLQEKQTTIVNGQNVEGPLLILKNSLIREVSFCALGADRNTNAKVFNTSQKLHLEGDSMDVKPTASLDRDLALQTLTDERNQFKADIEALKSKQAQFVSDNAELQGQIKALQFENRTLNESLVTARKEADEARFKFQALSKTSRKAILSEDFGRLGIEFKEDDDSVKAILDAEENIFEAFRKTLTNLKVTVSPPKGAFEEQTVPTDYSVGAGAVSISKMAAARAEKEKLNG